MVRLLAGVTFGCFIGNQSTYEYANGIDKTSVTARLTDRYLKALQHCIDMKESEASNSLPVLASLLANGYSIQCLVHWMSGAEGQDLSFRYLMIYLMISDTVRMGPTLLAELKQMSAEVRSARVILSTQFGPKGVQDIMALITCITSGIKDSGSLKKDVLNLLKQKRDEGVLWA